MNDTQPPLPLREKLGYGLGDFASNLIFATVSAFLMFFYTDIFGLSAAAVGTLLFVARTWDAVWDLLLGVIVDRTRSRYGQARPYILFGAPLLVVAAIATFTVPHVDSTGKLIYAYITYTLLMMAYSVVNIPYSSMPALMTNDPDERTRLAGIRMFMAFCGTLLVGGLTLPLVGLLGGGDKQKGYQLTVALLAVLSMFMFWVCFALCRERAPYVRPEITVRPDMQALMRFRGWWLLLGMGIVFFTALTIPGGSALYYFTYVVGDTKLATGFLIAGGLGMLTGVVISDQLTRRFCKRNVMRGSACVAAVLAAGFYFIDPKVLWQVYGLKFILQTAGAMGIPVLWSMVADIADDAERRTGRRVVGLTTASVAFSHKFGMGLGAVLTGIILAAIGYQANTAQSAQTIHGLIVVMSVIPATGYALIALLVTLYPLKRADLAVLKAELSAQRDIARAAEPKRD